MQSSSRRPTSKLSAILILLAGACGPAFALQVPDKGGRFDALAITDAMIATDVATMPDASLPSAARGGWDAFRESYGADWSVSLDRRSGAPLLVSGQGIALPVDAASTVDSIAATLRTFIAANRSQLLADDAELVLDREASGLLQDDVWQIVFGRRVSGVPVYGERYLFTIGHGRLMSFGAPRWSRIEVSPAALVDEAAARGQLSAYMGLTKYDAVTDFARPQLQIVPLRSGPSVPNSGYYDGAIGAGYGSALVWRFSLRVAGDRGTWIGLVDAHSGAVRAFTDNNKYVRVKGGIYPLSDDQVCPDGCEQPNFPMPFANVTINAGSAFSTTMGSFNCTPAGATATTTLNGQYFRVNDLCGAVSQSVTCSADLDLSSSAGTDCTVPPGSSAGNTHAARSTFYHLNRIAEHVRTWLPSVGWLTSQVPDNVNINSTCNAVWDGEGVNFFKSGGGCNNTAELAGVTLHEWGHGLDQNDGGDFDSPAEGYADIVAIMQTHASCIGRGFRQFGNCGGYGDACLSCSGVREQDWDAHASHTPATPANFVQVRCPGGGGGPCGRADHCEGHVGAQTLWDLAVRDLPASGLTAATSWQLADKLWYKSRLGSGGDAYNCSLPDSDGCSASSWFSKIRAVDDDDGNLANGTPHAAAIFAAFDRHKIACGAAGDPSNQNTNTCTPLAAPALSVSPGPASAVLSWTPVPNVVNYRILRNDAGCNAAFTRLALTSGTGLTDPGLANAFPVYYTIQALSANAACDGPVSNCQAVTPQPFAATIKMNQASYACSGGIITVDVVDGNVGAPPTASLVSTTEGTPEVIPLTRIFPGSTTYRGTINTTAAAPVHDGVLSVKNGDAITATYVDASDGGGGTNLARVTGSLASCVTPGVRPGLENSLTASRADALATTINVLWNVASCSSTDHHLLYGDLAGVASSTPTGSACNLGTTGSYPWAGVPSGNVWFVVVGDDDAATEGSWGAVGGGAPRGGATVSGQCGMGSRDNSGTCP